MTERMYGEFAEWWHLMSTPADYEEEAQIYIEALERVIKRPIERVLELGSGGGNNASHLKARYEMTLVDLSASMLAQSERINPECEHVVGDMRTLRLDRTFDAVFVHDAVMYLRTQEDLEQLFETAATHLEPGGAVLCAPDDTTESYQPDTDWGGHDEPGRSMRYLQWTHPARGNTFVMSMSYLFREGDGLVRGEYEEHELGLHPHAAWMDAIRSAGLRPRALPYRHSTFRPGAKRELFAGVKPLR